MNLVLRLKMWEDSDAHCSVLTVDTTWGRRAAGDTPACRGAEAKAVAGQVDGKDAGLGKMDAYASRENLGMARMGADDGQIPPRI